MWSRTLSALITPSQKRISLVTKTCVNSSRKRAEKPCGMQLHFLRKSNIGQTNVTRFFSSRAPLPWLNSDSFPPPPMIFITSGKVRSTTATSNSRFINYNFLQEPIVLVWVRSRAKSIRLLHPKRTRPQGGRDSAYERGGDARRKF